MVVWQYRYFKLIKFCYGLVGCLLLFLDFIFQGLGRFQLFLLSVFIVFFGELGYFLFLEKVVYLGNFVKFFFFNYKIYKFIVS